MEPLDHIHETQKRQLLLKMEASVERAVPVWWAECTLAVIAEDGCKANPHLGNISTGHGPQTKSCRGTENLSSAPRPTSAELQKKISFPSFIGK